MNDNVLGNWRVILLMTLFLAGGLLAVERFIYAQPNGPAEQSSTQGEGISNSTASNPTINHAPAQAQSADVAQPASEDAQRAMGSYHGCAYSLERAFDPYPVHLEVENCKGSHCSGRAYVDGKGFIDLEYEVGPSTINGWYKYHSQPGMGFIVNSILADGSLDGRFGTSTSRNGGSVTSGHVTMTRGAAIKGSEERCLEKYPGMAH